MEFNIKKSDIYIIAVAIFALITTSAINNALYDLSQKSIKFFTLDVYEKILFIFACLIVIAAEMYLWTIAIMADMKKVVIKDDTLYIYSRKLMGFKKINQLLIEDIKHIRKKKVELSSIKSKETFTSERYYIVFKSKKKPLLLQEVNVDQKEEIASTNDNVTISQYLSNNYNIQTIQNPSQDEYDSMIEMVKLYAIAILLLLIPAIVCEYYPRILETFKNIVFK